MSLSWSVTGTIPPGLALDPNLGIISGTPTTSGTFSFTINTSDGLGGTGSQAFSVTISPASVTGAYPLVISPTTLPPGTVGQTYTVQLGAVKSGGTMVFPADHILNTPIDQAPLLANSAEMIAQMVTDNTAVGQPSVTVHPGFEMPINEGIFPMTAVTGLSSDSDAGPYAVPVNALVEVGDGHMLARETDTNYLYEIYLFVQGPPVSGSSGAIWDLNSYALRPLWNTSSDAAGLPVYPLLIRYAEFAVGVINHALRVTVQATRNFGSYAGVALDAGLPATPPATWPARHRGNLTNTNPNDPSQGERFRLQASFDDSAFSPETKIITACLKKYGCIVADQGGNVLFGLQGDTNPAWLGPTPNSPAGVAYTSLTDKLVTELRNVPLTAFEVVDGVTDYIISSDSGQAKQPFTN